MYFKQNNEYDFDPNPNWDKENPLSSDIKINVQRCSLSDILRNKGANPTMESDTFTIFLNALQHMNMTHILHSSTRQALTIFVPSDNAFRKYYSSDFIDSIIQSKSMVPLFQNDSFKAIINYHIVENSILLSKNISKTKLLFSKHGDLLLLSTNGNNDYFVNGIAIQTSDLVYENGVAHVIGNLLIPKLNLINNSNKTSVGKKRNRKYNINSNEQRFLHKRGRPVLLVLQFALRILSRQSSSVIDGSMAGDLGFDPLGNETSIKCCYLPINIILLYIYNVHRTCKYKRSLV
jgi:uncharacterized surface protein with fasciclin (FAS1) repeats